MANRGFKTYSADEVICIIGNVPVNEGLADGTFVSVEFEASFSDAVGSDGEVTRSKSNDGRCTITVTLMQTSDVNDLLTAQYLLDQNTPGGAPVTFLLKDTNGRTLIAAENCWLQQLPTIEFGREAGNREWTFRASSADIFIGGN